MTNELDALIIRSLPELNESAVRLVGLDQEIDKEIDAEVMAWAGRNGWRGNAKWQEEGIRWLAPEDWMVPDDPDENCHLFFTFDYTSATPEDRWNVVSLTGAGQQQGGFWLSYDQVKGSAFKRLWKAHLAGASGLPLHGSDFFLPIRLDREALATAVLNGSIADALDTLRETLDRLPELASQLDSFKATLVAATGSGVGGARTAKA